MASISKQPAAYDLYDDREDLLSNVQALKERISLTERTLSSLSSPNAKRPSSRGSRRSSRSPKDRHALTVAELNPTPRPVKYDQYITITPEHSTPQKQFHFSQYKRGVGGVDMVDSGPLPVSPGWYKATPGSGDCNPEDLRTQLHLTKQENITLLKERNDLRNKLDTAYSQMNQLNTAQLSSSDDVSTYKRLISQLQESIVCLQSEIQTQDQAIKKSESRYNNSQKEVTESNRRLRQCSDMLKVTEERMKEQQTLIKALRMERDEALGKAEDLDTELVHAKAAGSHSLVSLKDNLQKREEEKKTLTQHNKELRMKMSELEHDLSSKEKQLMTITGESSHLSSVNVTLNQQIKELTGRLHVLDCEVTEAKTLTNQNGTLHGTILLLKQQLDEKENMLRTEIQHNERFTKDMDILHAEVKLKTEKLKTIKDQFGFMENGLLKQKDRINTLEVELQQTDQVKMENIELKCQLEETQRKLHLCQQEIAVTSSQLSQLEDLASRIENRENFNSSGSHHEITELRLALKSKNTEIVQLQNTLEDTEAKLRLSQLALDAKEKVQNKADKIVNDGEKVRLQSELNRLKNKQSEAETRSNVVQSRLKELQTDLSSTRKKLETTQSNNKDLRQQKSAREAEIKTLKAKISELEKNNKLHGSEMEEQCTITERLQRKITSLKRDLTTKTSENEQQTESLKLQCEQLPQQINAAQKQREEYKSRLADLQSEFTSTQQSIIKLEGQLESKDKTIEQLNKELETVREEAHLTCSELSDHVQSCEDRIVQLESAVSVSKQEREKLSNQIRDEKQAHDRQLNQKDEFIKEYQTRLKSSQKSLQVAESELSESRQKIQTNRQTEGENARQVIELQQRHTELKSQVANMEQTLQKVSSSHQRELLMMTEKLQSTMEQLEQAKIHKQQTNDQLRDLEKDKASLLIEIDTVESKLSRNQTSDKSRIDKLTDLETELRETQNELSVKTDEINELEDRLHKMEIDLEHQTLINTQFEGEFRRAQNDLKSAMNQMEELQEMLSISREDKKSVEVKLKEMEKSLRMAQDELHSKNCEIEELDDQIQKQEKQLLNRAQQVSQLDVTINSYRAEVETQLRQTSEQLMRCQHERDQTAQQALKLQESVTQLTHDLESRHSELNISQSQVLKLESELLDKSRQVCDLESRLDNLEDKSEGLMHGLTNRSSEVNAKNDLIKRYEDQVERLQFELTESKIERQTLTDQYNEAKQQLQEYLDTVYKLEQRLLECEQTQSGKSAGLEGAKYELEQLQLQHRKEIARLEDAQNDFLETKSEMEASYSSRLREVENRERQLHTQLDMSHDQIESLRAELSRRLELVKNANEAVVIKEAEIARLEAKVSGIERKMGSSCTQLYSSLNGTRDTKVTKAEYRSHRPPMDMSISSSLLSPIKRVAGGSRFGDGHAPSLPASEDPMVLRQRATRALFSPGRPGSSPSSPKKSASFLDSLDLASKLEHDVSAQHDTLYLKNSSHNHTTAEVDEISLASCGDNTLAREREELFARLDELNKQPVESLTKETVSQTVAHLIQSAARSAEKEDRMPSLIPEYGPQSADSSESLTTMRIATPDILSSPQRGGSAPAATSHSHSTAAHT